MTFSASCFHITEQLTGGDASYRNIDEPVCGNFASRQRDFEVVRGQGRAGPLFHLVQGEGRKALSHLRGEEGLAFGADHRTDFLTAFARHAAVHLPCGGRGGSAGPPRKWED